MSGITHFTTSAEYDETCHAAANNGTGADLMEESVYLFDTAGPEEPFDTLCKICNENSPGHATFVTLCNEAGIRVGEPFWFCALVKHFGNETLMARVGLNN